MAAGAPTTLVTTKSCRAARDDPLDLLYLFSLGTTSESIWDALKRHPQAGWPWEVATPRGCCAIRLTCSALRRSADGLVRSQSWDDWPTVSLDSFLAAFSRFDGLRSLTVRAHSDRQDRIVSIFQARRPSGHALLTTLQHLYLHTSSNALTFSSELLAALPSLPALVDLTLAMGRVVAAVDLLPLTRCSRLLRLTLDAPSPPQPLEVLKDLPNLEHLHLHYAPGPWTCIARHALLRSLDVSNTYDGGSHGGKDSKVAYEGHAALAATSRLTLLTALRFAPQDHLITETAVRAEFAAGSAVLATLAPTLTNLVTLLLPRLEVDADAIAALHAMSRLTKLQIRGVAPLQPLQPLQPWDLGPSGQAAPAAAWPLLDLTVRRAATPRQLLLLLGSAVLTSAQLSQQLSDDHHGTALPSHSIDVSCRTANSSAVEVVANGAAAVAAGAVAPGAAAVAAGAGAVAAGAGAVAAGGGAAVAAGAAAAAAGGAAVAPNNGPAEPPEFVAAALHALLQGPLRHCCGSLNLVAATRPQFQAPAASLLEALRGAAPRLQELTLAGWSLDRPRAALLRSACPQLVKLSLHRCMVIGPVKAVLQGLDTEWPACTFVGPKCVR